MKQQIVCPDCHKELRDMFPTDTPYPGEHVKFVEGVATMVFLCDHCEKRINVGDPCTAFSIWADHGAQPYYPWEDAYIEESAECDGAAQITA